MAAQLDEIKQNNKSSEFNAFLDERKTKTVCYLYLNKKEHPMEKTITPTIGIG